MVPKSIRKREKRENGKLVKIGVSLKRNNDFQGSEASKIDDKSLKKRSPKQERTKNIKQMEKYDFGTILGAQNGTRSVQKRVQKMYRKTRHDFRRQKGFVRSRGVV